MITGEDISRIPEVVNPNDKKPETIQEEEKPSYAAVARSRPTSECNDNELVEDPIVEDVVEEPGMSGPVRGYRTKISDFYITE